MTVKDEIESALRAGQPAKQVSRLLSVSEWRVYREAYRLGINLKPGRPRTPTKDKAAP